MNFRVIVWKILKLSSVVGGESEFSYQKTLSFELILDDQSSFAKNISRHLL